MQKLTLTYAETAVCMAKRLPIARRALSMRGRVCGRGAPARHGKPPGQPWRIGTPIIRNDSGYKLGQRVRHAKFGEGTMSQYESRRRA
ncbi:hypothetical protein ACLB1Q_21185 [Escherichia coli]